MVDPRRLDPATLRVAWWTIRSLRTARRQLQDKVELGAVAIRDPPAVSDTAGRGMSAVLRRRDDTCLERALVRQRWHLSQGRARDIVIGVPAPGPDFVAHAWLEGDPPETYAQYHEISRVRAL